MTSHQFVAFLEQKFQEHGVKKVIPDEKTIQDVYVKTLRQLELQARMKNLVDEINKIEFEIPAHLMDAVKNKLEGQSDLPWDFAVVSVAESRR